MKRLDNETDRRLSLLVGLVVVCGIAALAVSAPTAVAGLVGDGARPALQRLVVVVGLVAVGTLINVRVRVRSTSHGISWVDAAQLVGLAMMPYQWVVVAAAAGMTVANVVR